MGVELGNALGEVDGALLATSTEMARGPLKTVVTLFVSVTVMLNPPTSFNSCVVIASEHEATSASDVPEPKAIAKVEQFPKGESTLDRI